LFFQRFLKGIPVYPDFQEPEAQVAVEKQGILCNWWRDVHGISPFEIQQKLTEHNLYFHLSGLTKVMDRSVFERTDG
jgi:hypothetical protein